MKRLTFLGALLAIGLLAVGAILSAEQKELDAQYAQTLLQLDQSLLQRAQSINALTPGEISPQQVQVLQRELIVGQQVADQAQKTGKLPWFTIMLAFAEARQNDAQHAWTVADLAHAANSNAISAADLEVLRLRAELARLNLLRGRQLTKASIEEQQNWGLTALLMEFQHHRSTTNPIGP